MENNYKRGDRVRVRDYSFQEWIPATYLTTIQGAKYPIICVGHYDKGDFENGAEFCHEKWKQIQPLTPETIEIDGKKYNKEELLKRIDTFKALGYRYVINDGDIYYADDLMAKLPNGNPSTWSKELIDTIIELI